MPGACQPMAHLARAESVSFKAGSMEDLAAKKVESGRNRGSSAHWTGAVKMVLLIDLQPSSAAADHEGVLLTMGRLVGSAEAAFTIMWRPP